MRGDETYHDSLLGAARTVRSASCLPWFLGRRFMTVWQSNCRAPDDPDLGFATPLTGADTQMILRIAPRYHVRFRTDLGGLEFEPIASRQLYE